MAEPWNLLGLALAARGKYAEAASAYESALVVEPNSAMTHTNAGVAYRRIGRIDQAIHHHTRARELRLDLPIVYYNLASDYAALGLYDNAREIHAHGVALEKP